MEDFIMVSSLIGACAFSVVIILSFLIILGLPKVFFKYFYINTATGEKSAEMLASAVLSNA